MTITAARNPKSSQFKLFWKTGLKHPLKSVFCLALILRLLYYAILSNTQWAVLEPDSFEYLSIARSLCENASFMRFENCYDLKRTPIYPLFLALLGAGSQFYGLVVLVQILLSTLTAVILVQCSRALNDSPQMSFSAGLIAACEPLSIIYSPVILSETVFVFLIVTGLLLCTWHFQPNTEKLTAQSKLALPTMNTANSMKNKILGTELRRSTAIGLVLALAILTRPIAILLTPITLLLIVTTRHFKKNLVVHLICFLGLGLTPVYGWIARNAWHSGRPLISTIGATNLMDYRACGVFAELEKKPYSEIRKRIRQEYGTDDRPMTAQAQAQIAQKKQKSSLEILKANPKIVCQQSLRGAAVIAMGPGAGMALKSLKAHPGKSGLYHALVTFNGAKLKKIWRSLAGKRLAITITTLIFGGFYCSFYCLLAGGIWAAMRSTGSRTQVLVMTCALLPLWLAPSGPEAEPRFRLPIMPFLILLAVQFLAPQKTTSSINENGLDEEQPGQQHGTLSGT